MALAAVQFRNHALDHRAVELIGTLETPGILDRGKCLEQVRKKAGHVIFQLHLAQRPHRLRQH